MGFDLPSSVTRLSRILYFASLRGSAITVAERDPVLARLLLVLLPGRLGDELALLVLDREDVGVRPAARLVGVGDRERLRRLARDDLDAGDEPVALALPELVLAALLDRGRRVEQVDEVVVGVL